jgi:chromodomain-containing protein/integrase-like protein
MTTKELNARQARWAEELASYDFRIEHIKGKENKVADALSRRADYRGDKTDSVQEPMLIEGKEGALILNSTMKSKMITLKKDELMLAIKERKPHGTMMIEKEPPTEPWRKLTADFLEMPETTNAAKTEVYDELLVVVDTFSKATVLIPTKKTATSEEIFHLLWERIFAVYGIPEEILSDRDRIFKTEKWSRLMIQIGARQQLSTAYHQQTDGQTERKIQELRAYFRHYLDYEQRNWVELTPLAQYALNDATNATTGETPNFIVFGTRRIHNREIRNRETDSPHQETMKRIHKEVELDLEWNKLMTKKYYDLKRNKTPQFQVGERVYLRRRTSGERTYNIKTGRASQKLDSVKLGPYRVQERMENDNYKLTLPPRMRVHPIFHVSLLSLTKNPESFDEIGATDEYEVEQILDKRESNGTTEYLVKWKDYAHDENTWEPMTNLYCPDRIQEYNDRLRSRGTTQEQPREALVE